MAETLPEARFCEELRRALLTPRARMAVVLRLSRLRPPAPRVYHRRIASSILAETASACEGEVFWLGSGDAAMLCHAPAVSHDAGTTHPQLLPHVFARLFRIDLPDARPITECWTLGTDTESALAYAHAALAAAG